MSLAKKSFFEYSAFEEDVGVEDVVGGVAEDLGEKHFLVYFFVMLYFKIFSPLCRHFFSKLCLGGRGRGRGSSRPKNTSILIL